MSFHPKNQNLFEKYQYFHELLVNIADKEFEWILIVLKYFHTYIKIKLKNYKTIDDS